MASTSAPRANARAALKAQWPGREKECARLLDLLGDPALALPLYLHGPSGCGKSAVLRATLEALCVPVAYLDCITMPTAQSLFDSCLNQLVGHTPSAANGYTSWAPCDSVGAFVEGLRRIVKVKRQVVIVLDKAERLAARGANRDLLLSLIELPNLFAAAAAAHGHGSFSGSAAGAVQLVFVGETLWPDFQRLCEGDPRVVHFRFPGYSMEGLAGVLKRDVHAVLPEQAPIRRKLEHRVAEALTPGESTAGRPVHEAAFHTFVSGFVDQFSEVCRDTHELRYLCRQLFPMYLQPAAEGDLALTDTRNLHARMKPHFRRALRSVYSRDGLMQEETAASVAAASGALPQPTDHHIAARAAAAVTLGSLGGSVQLPTAGQLLLISGYLAARLPSRADVSLFSSGPRKPGRKSSGPRNAKLSSTPKIFTVDRLLAIYASIAPPEPGTIAAAAAAAANAPEPAKSLVPPVVGKPPTRCEVLVQLASLVDLRLFTRASNEANLDLPRMRCEAARELVLAVADHPHVKFDLRQFEEE